MSSHATDLAVYAKIFLLVFFLVNRWCLLFSLPTKLFYYFICTLYHSSSRLSVVLSFPNRTRNSTNVLSVLIRCQLVVCPSEIVLTCMHVLNDTISSSEVRKPDVNKHRQAQFTSVNKLITHLTRSTADICKDWLYDYMNGKKLANDIIIYG